MNILKKGLLALAVSSSLAFAVLAHANGGTFVPTELWCGTYFGGYFGGGHGNLDQDITFTENLSQQISAPQIVNVQVAAHVVGSGSASGDATGSLTTPFIGYNFHPQSPRWSRIVLGAQLEGTLFNDLTFHTNGVINSSVSASAIQNGTQQQGQTALASTGINLRDDLRSMLSLVGRAGVLVRPTWLVYGLAGFTEGHFVLPCCDDLLNTLSQNSIFGNNNSLGASASPNSISGGSGTGTSNKWEPGYILGGGLEWRYNEHWSIRGEYRYAHFSFNRDSSNTTTANSTLSEGNASANVTLTQSLAQSTHTSLDFNSGQIGVVYRFS